MSQHMTKSEMEYMEWTKRCTLLDLQVEYTKLLIAIEKKKIPSVELTKLVAKGQ